METITHERNRATKSPTDSVKPQRPTMYHPHEEKPPTATEMPTLLLHAGNDEATTTHPTDTRPPPRPTKGICM